MGAAIRPYEPGDLDALYDVCLRTGAAGGDASGLVDDPRLLGDLFAAPYAVFEPTLAFVAADDAGVGGYVVGTADTARFDARREAAWYPPLRARHPEGSGGTELEARLVGLLHRPRRRDPAVVAAYPAHLHVDLLPRLQGQGAGRRLLDTFCAAALAVGATGVHLGVNPANERALGFYRHLGYHEVASDAWSVTLARWL